MEYTIQRKSAGKRKAERDLTHKSGLKSKKKDVATCIEVLSKDYFQACMTELDESMSSGFARLISEISILKAKLKNLDNSFKSLQKVSNMENVQLDDLTIKQDLKTIFDTAESTDSSLEILSVTPSKTNDEKKMKKIDMKIKKYGMLLDTGEGMGKHKHTGKPNSYDPFAVADPGKIGWIDSWMNIDRDITVNLGIVKADKKFFAELIEPNIWLRDDHIDVGMSLMRRKLGKVSCPFRSKRLAFLDIPFTFLISKSYHKFLENPMNFDWSSEFIDYYNGALPRCERTNKRLGVDVDDAYVVLNIKNVHWIALAISVLRRSIEVYDSIITLSSDDEITEFVKLYALMIPYLIKSLASPADQNDFNAAEYTIKRCRGIPQNKQSGDCGVYAIKYIECLALDTYMEPRLCDANIKDIRKKLATDMFVEANHTEDS